MARSYKAKHARRIDPAASRWINRVRSMQTRWKGTIRTRAGALLRRETYHLLQGCENKPTQATVLHFEHALSAYHGAWQNLFNDVYRSSYPQVKKYLHVSQSVPQQGLTQLDRRVMDDFVSRSASKAQMIQDSTRNTWRGIISRGLRDGLSDADLTQKLKDRVPRRVEAIAVTQANSALQESAHRVAMLIAAKPLTELADYDPEVGEEPELLYSATKTWEVTSDNPRAWHEEADGQTVAVDEPFYVMDEEMMYPGDDAGSPENVINCECVASYEGLGGVRGSEYEEIPYSE